MATVVTAEPTGNDYIDGLLHGTKWSGQTIFSFPSMPYEYPAGYPIFVDVDQLYTRPMETMRAILAGSRSGYNSAQWYNSVSAFTQLDIINRSITGGVDIRIAQNKYVTTAFAYYPEADTFGAGGDIWLPTRVGDFSQVRMGQFASQTLMALAGRALGLKPSGEAGGIGNVAVPADRDSIEYTVMSLRAYPGGPTLPSSAVEPNSHPQTFMALDIQALQTLYGADYGTNSGNTVYSWDQTTGQMSLNGLLQAKPATNKIFMTIWDGGGTDTYDLSNYDGAVSIDLGPGAATITSQAQRPSFGNGVFAKGSIYNSYLFKDNPASLIENAIGGWSDDTLRGNQGDNVLNGGGAGADHMTGLAGNDSYVIDSIYDVVVEQPGEGTDTIYVRINGYTLPANVEQVKLEEGFGNLSFTGNALANVLTGNSGNNGLYGGDGADTLFGLAGDDHLEGGAGPDVMVGGAGNDTYIVGHLSDVVYEAPNQGTDTLWTSVNRGLDADFENIALFGGATIAGGNALNNTVSGNFRDNTLYSGGGSDSLYGQAGSDRLFGEDGNDYMTGGAGTDAYYGGASYDYAILEEGGGVDYFVDWNVAQDRVVFDSDIFSSIGAALKAAFQNGTDVVIWDGSDGIVLQNAKLADLTTSNFLIT